MFIIEQDTICVSVYNAILVTLSCEISLYQNERLTITKWILYMARVAIRRELPQIKDEDQLEM